MVVLVFPVPAPASTRISLSRHSIAASCSAVGCSLFVAPEFMVSPIVRPPECSLLEVVAAVVRSVGYLAGLDALDRAIRLVHGVFEDTFEVLLQPQVGP